MVSNVFSLFCFYPRENNVFICFFNKTLATSHSWYFLQNINKVDYTYFSEKCALRFCNIIKHTFLKLKIITLYSLLYDWKYNYKVSYQIYFLEKLKDPLTFAKTTCKNSIAKLRRTKKIINKNISLCIIMIFMVNFA